MAGAGMEIVVSDEVDPELRVEIQERLYEHNVAATGIGDGRELAIVVHDDDGSFVGALVGWTWGGVLQVELLWVEPERRCAGVGSLLLVAAEAEARCRGCAIATVGTHTFQAPGFYARHGYLELARLEEHPRGHAELWLVKSL